MPDAAAKKPERPPIILERRQAAGHYRQLLKRIHQQRRPSVYIEIGVQRGRTLALAQFSNLAVGIDPVPRIEEQLPKGAVVSPVESDKFFETEVEKTLNGRKIDFGFVDGLHVFEQALRDILNIERYANADGIIAVHDVMPIDERTAFRDRETQIWTGDVWKAIYCMARLDPAVQITTVQCAPSGLAIIQGLSPDRRLSENDLNALYAYGDSLKFGDYERSHQKVLNVVNEIGSFKR